MQATYCDICGERIRTKGVRKEVPIYFTDGIRWIESDICNECVEAIAQCCSKLKEQEMNYHHLTEVVSETRNV